MTLPPLTHRHIGKDYPMHVSFLRHQDTHWPARIGNGWLCNSVVSSVCRFNILEEKYCPSYISSPLHGHIWTDFLQSEHYSSFSQIMLWGMCKFISEMETSSFSMLIVRKQWLLRYWVSGCYQIWVTYNAFITRVIICITMKVLAMQSCLTLLSHGLEPTRLLWPWNSLGKNTGVGCRGLLQGIFSTQGLNPVLLDCRQILYHLSHQGSPTTSPQILIFIYFVYWTYDFLSCYSADNESG